MRTDLISSALNSYKANMHCHSTLSDGTLTPEELKRVYMAHGYQIIAFTDHNILADHSELDEANFLSLPACEVDVDKYPDISNYSYQVTHHLNIYLEHPEHFDSALLSQKRCTYSTDSINQFISSVAELGGLVCYNHPDWSLQKIDTYGQFRGLFAMEIFNFGCEIEGMNGNSQHCYDRMLRGGQKIFCIAADDNHNWEPFHSPKNDSFGGFIVIQASELNRSAVFSSLREGRFYSSNGGPTITGCYVEDDMIYITAPGTRHLYVLTKGRKTYSKHSDLPFEEGAFHFSPEDGYLRVVCLDEKGRFSATNAYWI